MAERKSLTEAQKESARIRSRAHYYANKEKKLAYQKKYREENKEKIAEYRMDNKERISTIKKKWRGQNKEHVIEYEKEYRRTHVEERIKYDKKYYTENKENNKERNRARAAKWYKENPERGKANAKVQNHRRRARVAKVGGVFTKEDIRTLYITQGARCYYCSINIEEGYHIEHMLPICRGGTNGPENLCLACATCNRSKHTKTAEEFMNVC